MSIVKKYNTEVSSVMHHGNDVYTLEFKLPHGRFKYFPGQFLHLALSEYDPSAAWPDSRCFSMQSSPEEDVLRITYSVKGGFTQQMREKLVAGAKIWVKMPFGDLFTQAHNKQNTVFISGGTGITPYLSLFTNKNFTNYTNPHLYAGFRNKEHNLYSKEIGIASQINPSLQVTAFYQDTDGIIDINRILQENKDKENVSYFISGPPVMIKNFKAFLLQNGVAENQVKTDEWE